ncbi:N-acetylglucosaminyl deacetylase, LmbE family [Micromonospora nigra]|uniref:N-acetylglucosaminyl deacetylase, LmbE family n=1 Tax=Micromonospora nigra TaxID=145857 RepID=A0A1C6RXY6_9ACTN|nr:PIG-L family deacetylase [Micromonospora nigra]SCL21892.1 N-acetylglucosaminyl deacetylase, LmbE family [Micromonospora nigra]
MTGRTGRRHRPRRAVAVSPHLDDAVFSVGGTLAALVAAGWFVEVLTCFTASVPDPAPFALSTQLDKGLPAHVDYLALRRAEDAAACRRLGVRPVHLPLPEAPHRGYDSAPELFAGVRPDDPVGEALVVALRPRLLAADLVLAPQALGGHVDHRVVAEAVVACVPDALWWRDVPYVSRAPDERPWRAVPPGVEQAVDIRPYLDVKVDAAGRYRTQLDFQFGGPTRVGPALHALAAAEAGRLAGRGAVEVLWGPAGRLASTGVV